ncbi:MAG: hypothetical protein KA163_07105 [Bacteroidia bacterium]|nr:hypothetical protein [Bacteroidia bacterium]
MSKTLDFYINEGKFISIGAQASFQLQQSSSAAFQEYLNNMIERINSQPNYHKLNFQDICKLTSQLTHKNVIQDGNAWNDFNSVGWHMIILCFVYKKSLPALTEFSIDDIFIQSWKEYFTAYSN